MTINIGQWRSKSKKKLAEFSNDTDIEILALLKNFLVRDTAWILAHPEFILSSEEVCDLDKKIERLVSGEPLAYIINQSEFFGIPFYVNENVLIPRPDTEILVEKALEWCKNQPQIVKFVDIGTGSGCIGISILNHFPEFTGYGVDISYDALKVANQNRNLVKQGAFQLIQADLLSFTNEKFDLVCANLPYIPTSKLLGLSVSKFEPAIALNGGINGTDIIMRLLQEIDGHMKKAGLILLEIQNDQGKIVQNFATEIFPDSKISILKDLSGNDRVISIELQS
jgi:release factor glutamine methyltransferase